MHKMQIELAVEVKRVAEKLKMTEAEVDELMAEFANDDVLGEKAKELDEMV